jgi:hypothetical protein
LKELTMTLNARMSKDDPRLYNPSRDVAHNFDQIIMEVASRCEKHTWDVLNKLAQEKGLTDEELGKACQCLCKFVAHHPERGESMGSCMAACGFLECPDAARVIVAAYMGTVILGMHWAGVREATLGGQGPTLNYQRLRWHGMMCVKRMQMPRWKRSLYILSRRIKAAWRVLWQKDEYGG